MITSQGDSAVLNEEGIIVETTAREGVAGEGDDIDPVGFGVTGNGCCCCIMDSGFGGIGVVWRIEDKEGGGEPELEMELVLERRRKRPCSCFDILLLLMVLLLKADGCGSSGGRFKVEFSGCINDGVKMDELAVVIELLL